MGSDSEDDMEEEEEEQNKYRIPLSNEIVLKGHTKVVSALAVDHSDQVVLCRLGQLEPSEGHQVRSLSWSPTADRFLCVTGSAWAKIYDRDGLTLGEFVRGDIGWLRLWDVNDFKSQKQVIKPKLARPGRVPVTTCAWDREGKSIAGGIWNLKPGWGSRPDIYVANAHSDDITGVKFSSDGRILLSRSFDGSLKVWDLLQMKEPLRVFNDLPNNYAQTNIAFSPDEQLVVQCAWHPRLNQIFATVGDKHEGKVQDDFQAEPVIHNPHALPLFRDQPSRKRQREKVLKDPLKSHKPELPMTGPGFGGRVGSTKGSLLTQYLLKQGGLIKETWMEEDPREAILKHADAAAKDPKYIAPAYADTQPEPLFCRVGCRRRSR
ncbi:hypothetical protein HAX54_011624 [Datura stramonium]|uniref:Uncharacterized protein n=1 Tax=Datura stramonium TaxID=4076 RepID=A0ABS8TK80_DATST|nr:hypothetical protein [Datura stramonium]